MKPTNAGLDRQPREGRSRSSAAAPELWVPDNLRSGVSKASRYEPDVNPNYHDLAVHYGVAVAGTRPTTTITPNGRAGIDYHVELDGHYHSVPYQHARA